ncbi:alanyl-tRNA editing protein Aarsd1-A [Eupeodes corollae]|uniref:alanyl-tRNA editing protein Aarsd1-A n=1 Tax=Eupeodes corollae TaxID=290404 RepID=UPI0024912645|nr:alanyl-tRNA editing protein Aarsd1-A [Eupeodes corollae]XP_055913721.1 alanyl-tRNA editing protein Aarsd1-A [Eupeodes corollae]XP_055913722.1 alanyl-tRNA editing protein Aarsd1-A [Eupeodes corollae]
MVFKCQEDSFLKEFTGTIVSCEPANIKLADKELQGFNVVLDNTILFPEGGGQPCDYGTLNEKPVRSVIRKGSEAIHFVEHTEPFVAGENVKQKIDWNRRLDHMQQHSGQHLITALFSRDYNFDTTSWWLGADSSYIELATKDVTKEQLNAIEETANALIVEGREVSIVVTSPEDGIKFQDARAPRGLPADHVGPVRVIRIEGIESNMCCGTHVTNLSQLQAIKLLHAEKSKGKVYVHFLAGNRVVKKLSECYERELAMNNVLKGGPSMHLELIQKVQANLKTLNKSFQKLLKDNATMEAEKLNGLSEKPKYFSMHRKDGIEPDFINTFLRTAPTDIFYFLSVADNTGKGHVVLRGDPEVIAKLGPSFMELLDGKGSNSKGNNLQAKVNNVNKIKDCEAKLKQYFS